MSRFDLGKYFESFADQETIFDVAVIGAGASGTLVAAQFRRHAPTDGRLVLVESAPRPGRGVAYETPYCSYLLNVRACNMSAFPDDKRHFVRWLESRLPNSGPNSFAPRRLYGDYLAEILAEAENGTSNGPQIERVRGTAVNLTKQEDVWTVHLDDGSLLMAHNVVLALGNLLPPTDPLKLKEGTAANYFRNPWSPAAARGIAPDAPVFIIGTGLTMVDVVMALREGGHTGQIVALSRHGRLPMCHKPKMPRPLSQLPDSFDSPRHAIRWLRHEIEAAKREGCDWQSVVDSLRPYTAEIWQQWNLRQRASFLRHARSLWDVHRHRMAPELAMQINALIKQGVLLIRRGQLVSLEEAEQGEGFMVCWRLPDSNTYQQMAAARVVNCTGPARDYSCTTISLIVALREAGWLTPDSLRLGWETDDNGRLIGSQGTSVPGLYTLGPPRIPGLWESIAIPEIRVQAAELVKLLLSEAVPAPIAI